MKFVPTLISSVPKQKYGLTYVLVRLLLYYWIYFVVKPLVLVYIKNNREGKMSYPIVFIHLLILPKITL